jgi:hypothetical protein
VRAERVVETVNLPKARRTPMPRSIRRTTIIGFCGGRKASELQDKQFWHRRLHNLVRRLVRKLANTSEQYVDVHATPYHVSNDYAFRRDGKFWLNMPPRFLSK